MQEDAVISSVYEQAVASLDTQIALCNDEMSEQVAIAQASKESNEIATKNAEIDSTLSAAIQAVQDEAQANIEKIQKACSDSISDLTNKAATRKDSFKKEQFAIAEAKVKQEYKNRIDKYNAEKEFLLKHMNMKG